MTTDFEALHERPLRTDEFGEDAQVNINWGSKSTQFHGSLGKAAAAAAGQPTLVGSSPDDDGRVRISWRGDAAFFVVSTLDPYGDCMEGTPKQRRVIRVYDRDATLQATLEPTAGLEHPLAWRPSGNFIAVSQRFFGSESGWLGGGVGRPGRHDIVFFERNGLRRTEIEGRWSGLPNAPPSPADWDYSIKEFSWSCDSTILGVWISYRDGDVFQLWTTGNWHWYLKMTLRPVGSRRFRSVYWHPEHGRILFLSSPGNLREYTFEYETVASSSGPPNDLGMVAVIDRGDALLTPFRVQNVPPPSASHKLALSSRSSPPIHIALSPSGELLAALSYHPDPNSEHRYSLSVWNLHPRKGPGRGKIMVPELIVADSVDLHIPTQILLCEGAQNSSWLVRVLHTARDGKGEIVIYGTEEGKMKHTTTAICESNGRVVPSVLDSAPLLWQSRQGISTALDGTTVHLLVGVTNTKLYVVASGRGEALLVSPIVTSFTVSGTFLIYTTSTHESVYAPLEAIARILVRSSEGEGEDASTLLAACIAEWETRRVERGSRIVVAVPSAMNVVLQMPRGNLETIYPRPLALEVIRSDIARSEYGRAFSACRKHRIDLSMLVEQDPTQFLSNLSTFLEQLPDVDDLNLFLTVIGRSLSKREVTTQICDQIRERLQGMDPIKYMNTILTSYVVETPPQYEAALAHLHSLRDGDPQLVEDAVRYIIFLVDADKLFDVALGMYDFALVLLIAQHSQRDPREYLPFLRELKALERHYQRFRIDDHLKRYSKALKDLADGGPQYFSEALGYMEKHQLYTEGLSIWKGKPDEYKQVMSLYADWLYDRRDFEDAAMAFELACDYSKAMQAYEKAYLWRPLFRLAFEHDLDDEKVKELGYRVAENLCTRKRWADAAVVYQDYACDIEEAVRAYTNGNEVSDALRLATKAKRRELVEDIIHPGALDLISQMFEDLEEMETQLQKQASRIKELRLNKLENPNAFFGVEDLSLHNVDVTTDVSTPISTFTRYTVAPTSTSRSISKRTSRSKRKLDMKNAAGRKGTIEEETYILASWTKLSIRLVGLQNEAGKLFRNLRIFGEEHVTEGKRLQSSLIELEDSFKTIIDEVWGEPDINQQTGELPNTSTMTSEEQKGVASKPVKPTLGPRAWVLQNQFWL
ncbi:hypothetical protein FRC17_000043 [Serendipita sp. 399]|nr:hypothetical protein FRC17_000043 [Serendipita sp. 399]